MSSMITETKLQMWNKTKGVNMKLNELLKVNSVRCIKTKVHEDLVEGGIYKVEGFDDETIKIVDSNGFSSWHNKNLFEPIPNNDIDLDELIKHLEVGRSWKEIGCNHVVTITEIESGFANNIMVVFKSDCCLSSSPLRMFLKDFTPVINNDMSKSNSEIDISLNSVGVDLTKQQANDFCEKLTNDSEEYAYDWHYFEDVVVIKRLKKSLLDCQEG